MAEIRDDLICLLDDLNKEIPILSSSLITEDGIVITTNSSDESKEEVYMDFAAISASILSMAERGIEIINNNKILEQIKIDAGLEANRDADFTILITRVYSNVLLQIVFSKTTNIGLIQYEISKIIKKIRAIIKKDTSRTLFKSLGSLTM
jgi:predicted regulator of Ras-like GTPase activity (Roadblock/LC7/MglB family)